jgi:uncharacterized membrane protein
MYFWGYVKCDSIVTNDVITSYKMFKKCEGYVHGRGHKATAQVQVAYWALESYIKGSNQNNTYNKNDTLSFERYYLFLILNPY